MHLTVPLASRNSNDGIEWPGLMLPGDGRHRYGPAEAAKRESGDTDAWKQSLEKRTPPPEREPVPLEQTHFPETLFG